jgi:toxin ParE1/3/4
LKYAALSELAEGDLAEIWVAIARDDIETADQYLAELHARAQRLADQPFIGVARPDLGKEVRSLPHGAYLVIYRPTSFGVGIARVVHGARDLQRVLVPRE